MKHFFTLIVLTTFLSCQGNDTSIQPFTFKKQSLKNNQTIDRIESKVFYKNERNPEKQSSWQGQPLYDLVLAQFRNKFSNQPFLTSFPIDYNSYYLYKMPLFTGAKDWKPLKVKTQLIPDGIISTLKEDFRLETLQRDKSHNTISGLESLSIENIVLHQNEKKKAIYILNGSKLKFYPIYENLTIAQNLLIIDSKIEFENQSIIYFKNKKEEDNQRWHFLNEIELDDLAQKSIFMIYGDSEKIRLSSQTKLHLEHDNIHETDHIISNQSKIVIESIHLNQPQIFSNTSPFDCQVNSGIRREKINQRLQMNSVKEYLSESYLNIEGRVIHIFDVFNFDNSIKLNDRIIIPAHSNIEASNMWEFSFSQTTTQPVTVSLPSRPSGDPKIGGCQPYKYIEREDIKYQELKLSIF